jgi:hypothetical protein
MIKLEIFLPPKWTGWRWQNRQLLEREPVQRALAAPAGS